MGKTKARFAHILCAFGGGSSLRKDDEYEQSTMQKKTATTDAGSASGDPETSSG
jgi:hypothetical protein